MCADKRIYHTTYYICASKVKSSWHYLLLGAADIGSRHYQPLHATPRHRHNSNPSHRNGIRGCVTRGHLRGGGVGRGAVFAGDGLFAARPHQGQHASKT